MGIEKDDRRVIDWLRSRRLVLGLVGLLLFVAWLPAFNPSSTERNPLQWTLEPGIGRSATMTADAAGDGFGLDVLSFDSPEEWRVRVTRPVAVARGSTLRVRFLARAERERSIAVCLREGQAPYTMIGARRDFRLGNEWREVVHEIAAPFTIVDGRLQIQAGGALGKIDVRATRIDGGNLEIGLAGDVVR